MGTPGSFLQQLEKICGKPHVLSSPEDLVCYSADASGIPGGPDAVVFPESEAAVSEILALASKYRVNVIPRGAGSGMTGGAIALDGGVILVTTRMNRILDLDTENFIVRVQPGVIVADLHQHVEAGGLFYPPDPASSVICTIGGNVGECAGGPRAVKYGVTRDYVLGLRAVLPSGKIIQTGVRTAKGVAGYDLTRLIVGSEGTLAVVTEVTLKLLPKPSHIKTMAVFFRQIDDAASAVSGIMKHSIVPRCVEYIDDACLELVKDSISIRIPDETRAMLIIEVDGEKADVDQSVAEIETLCGTYASINTMIAGTSEETARLWEARKALSPILYKIAPNKLNEDIVVPISRIPDIVRETRKLQEKSGLKIVSFGHAGDGNIHCNIMYEKSDQVQTQQAEKALSQLFETVIALGGTITGEHGVGITKKQFLPEEIDPVQIELMRGIKNVFDPENILNPGKIF